MFRKVCQTQQAEMNIYYIFVPYDKRAPKDTETCVRSPGVLHCPDSFSQGEIEARG